MVRLRHQSTAASEKTGRELKYGRSRTRGVDLKVLEIPLGFEVSIIPPLGDVFEAEGEMFTSDTLHHRSVGYAWYRFPKASLLPMSAPLETPGRTGA